MSFYGENMNSIKNIKLIEHKSYTLYKMPLAITP
jgi:hypothetical protein